MRPRAEGRAASAMWPQLNAAGIAIPSGDRLDLPAFSRQGQTRVNRLYNLKLKLRP